MRIYKGRYYYDFQQLIPQLIKKQKGECFICGSSENLEAHHLKKARPGNIKYADENNLVIICNDCHNKYHQKYNKKEKGGINPKTFMIFKRDYDNKRINNLTMERNMFRNKSRKNENKLNILQEKYDKLLEKELELNNK